MQVALGVIGRRRMQVARNAASKGWVTQAAENAASRRWRTQAAETAASK